CASSWAQRPGLDENRCRLTVDSLPAAFARCSVLTVPEDPARPDGPSVDLFVARIAALSTTPRPDPLLIITGGPGQSAIDFYVQARGAFEQVRRERDLILLDQRGTGRSAGGFECDVPEDLALETAGAEALGEFVDQCLAALEHDPRFYTTSVAVQDLERLRVALDLPQWNVYGVSYGTRVAQHYVRRFPERVRALILDGVVPPEVALGPDVAIYAQRALDQIFARCAQDAACAARFTDLPARFSALLEQLAAEPFRTPALEPSDSQSAAAEASTATAFGAAHLQALVRFMSYSGQTAALLPLLLSDAYEGNYLPLVGQADTILRGLPEALSFPMSNAVVCAEDVPFMQEQATEGLDATYLGTAIVDGLASVCARWPAGVLDEDFKTPLRSDRPSLLLSGEADPITPPEYAQQVIAGGLTNSVHLIGRGQGHGLAVIGCVPRILRAFLETPVPQELDADCLAIEPTPPFFLSPMGPAL
ncbi:MAG TPA: alpha/beta fold hydrolase, partial [Gammaproteobacteria bacterium]|nr:alpha/beta fold hydrolase [Gammaproteobacteria bacterium]